MGKRSCSGKTSHGKERRRKRKRSLRSSSLGSVSRVGRWRTNCRTSLTTYSLPRRRSRHDASASAHDLATAEKRFCAAPWMARGVFGRLYYSCKVNELLIRVILRRNTFLSHSPSSRECTTEHYL